MPLLINMPQLEEQLIAKRRESGLDKFDEVWDGIYVMAPLANNEHQTLQMRLSSILALLIDFPGLGIVQAGANVSDQKHDWTKNYRCPDVVVFFNENPAEDRATHWFGGPDFAVEIVSPWDQSRDKLDFYASVGVRELLIIDREPWQMELYRLQDNKLRPAVVATEANASTVQSTVVPINLRFVPGATRPGIFVTASDGKNWTI